MTNRETVRQISTTAGPIDCLDVGVGPAVLLLTFRDQSRSILRAGRRGGFARRGRQRGSSEFRARATRAPVDPHKVVADLRAEPSADRERKVQAVDLTTKQVGSQTSLRSKKFRVIAGTFNGLDSSVRAIDLQPGA